ncbi:MAG: ATP-binding protein [Bacteroidetes bacterium]|nr:ATP-binding protein [Bacteroidota bacterium]
MEKAIFSPHTLTFAPPYRYGLLNGLNAEISLIKTKTQTIGKRLFLNFGSKLSRNTIPLHKTNMNYLSLGASLYLPATRSDLYDIVVNGKYPFLKSVILDTEDSVLFEDLETSYDNLKKLLKEISIKKKSNDIIVFVRPRNVEELEKIVSFEYIDCIDGFVFPKFSVENMHDYLKFQPKDKWYMPVLERNVFSEREITLIRDFLIQNKKNLLSVRIGITDILNLLRTRRGKSQVIYDIPVASHIISLIVSSFAPYDINISGPIFEFIGEDGFDLLRKEVKIDIQNGLFGKSAIHPSQVQIIQELYKVSIEEYDIACSILNPNSPAVYKLYDHMQEIKTHSEWAKRIIERKEIYGLN